MTAWLSPEIYISVFILLLLGGSRNNWIAFATFPSWCYKSCSAWKIFCFIFYHAATVVVVFDLRRLITIPLLLNSGVVSLRKQATYPAILSDSVVSYLYLVQDVYHMNMIHMFGVKEFKTYWKYAIKLRCICYWCNLNMS